MTSKLVVNTIESDTGISSVSFASSISMSSTSKFHFSAAGIDIGADTNINRPSAGVLGFNINSSEKARINSSGRLGLGTNNPDTTLTVQSGGDAQMSLKNSSGTTKAYVGTAGAFGSAGTDDLRIRSDSSNIVFGFSGAERLRIKSDGKVGIGTDTGNGLINTRHAGTNQQVLHVRADLGSSNNRTLNLYTPDTDSTETPFRFQTGNGYLFQCDSENVFTIAHDRRIGIGTINPSVLLDVQGHAGSGAQTTIRSKSTAANASNFVRSESSDGLYIGLLKYGTGHSAYGALTAGGGAVYANSSVPITIMSDGGSGYINFATGGNTERLRIKSDGVISFDQGTTAAVTPSQTTASSIGHQTMSGGVDWFNHSSGLDYFGVDGDWKLTNGATYGKIVARNASASISNATQAGHTWFLVCKTVAGTLGNSNWVVEPVAGWKMAWPTSLAAGAVATFYMRDAVESFGSPTIPASGDYYIGWFYSVSQQRGTNTGHYYVDATTGGKIYYYSGEGDMSNPHQRIPRQGDSWDNTMTGEKIHFRFETLPKADLTGTVFASPLLVDPVMEGVPLIDGLPMAGGQLVKDVQWATNVSSVEFTNADFVNCNYLLTYSINGSDGSGNSTGWYQTRLQFCDHDGAFFTGTNDYISHCEWNNSSSSSPSINSNFAGYQRSIWLTGNGSNYDHEGYVWIIPSNFRHNQNATISQRWGNGTEYQSLTHPRIFVRGHAHLSAGSDGTHYREEGGGTYRGNNDIFRISGFRLYGSADSNTHTPASNGSSNGYVRIWRFKSGFESRE